MIGGPLIRMELVMEPRAKKDSAGDGRVQKDGAGDGKSSSRMELAMGESTRMESRGWSCRVGHPLV